MDHSARKGTSMTRPGSPNVMSALLNVIFTLQTVTSSLRRAAFFLLCLALAACADASSDPDLFAGFGPVRMESPTPDASLEPVFIREYGSLSGEDTFGMPWSAVVRDDGSLVVADILDPCVLTVIDRPSGVVRGKLGRCGEGPGEFKMIMALATDADSLYVYDQDPGIIIVLDPEGIEARRFTVEGVGGPLNTVDDLALLDDSTMLIARSQVGRASVETVDRGTGRLRRVWFETPEDAELAETIRHLSACARPGSGPATIVAMNEWVFEGVGVSPETGEERLHFHTSFAGLRDDGDGPSSTRVRCGASVALFRGTTPGRMEDLGIAVTARAGVVVLEARGYDGTLRMRMILEDEGSLVRGALGAVRGDTLFLLNRTAREYPVVAEFVLQPGG